MVQGILAQGILAQGILAQYMLAQDRQTCMGDFASGSAEMLFRIGLFASGSEKMLVCIGPAYGRFRVFKQAWPR